MTTINIYLAFDGNCEEAFLFYESVFNEGKADIRKFKEMPENPEYPLSEKDLEKVMHVALPIGKHHVLMGSDTGGEWTAGFIKGNNFSVSVNASSKADADRLFNGLSKGGQLIMPMGKTFWDSYFGMFTDKFGIQWMISFDEPDRKK